MIKNFLFRPTSANMLHHPFVQNIKNEGHVVESLKKHLTGIIKKRQKKGKICELLFYWMRAEFIFFRKNHIYLTIRLKIKILSPSIFSSSFHIKL